MAAFATYNDLRARFDERVIAKYATDSGAPSSIPGLAANARVKAALLDATALITAACVKGNRYPRATLDGLAADEDKGALLRRMTCVLAMVFLLGNRVAGVDAVEEAVQGYKDALANLDALENGKLIFDLEGTVLATLPQMLAGPSFANVERNRPTFWNPIFGQFEPWRF